MKVIEIPGHELKIYDSLEDLTVARHIIFNRALALDRKPGSDFSKVTSGIALVGKLIVNGKYQEALDENNNVQVCINTILEGINFQMMAFSALVFEIDGKPVKVDVWDEALEVHNMMAPKVNLRFIKQIVKEAKKKWRWKWKFSFRKKRTSN